MIFRILGLSSVLLLAGCSSLPSLHGLFTYDRDEAVQVSAAPDAPAMTVPAPVPADDWCKTNAATARSRAVADGFDAPT